MREWPLGTVAILCTQGEKGPAAIPVSTALRVDERTILLALAARRASLARLRRAPRVALAVHAEGDVSLTAYGTARVHAPISENIVAVRIDVEHAEDHADARFTIEAGVSWRWTDPVAQQRDHEVREALDALARALRPAS